MDRILPHARGTVSEKPAAVPQLRAGRAGSAPTELLGGQAPGAPDARPPVHVGDGQTPPPPGLCEDYVTRMHSAEDGILLKLSTVSLSSVLAPINAFLKKRLFLERGGGRERQREREREQNINGRGKH